MFAAAMLLATTAAMLAMMLAGGIRIKFKLSGQQSFYRLIRIPGHAAIKRYTRLRQSPPGAAADAAAYERVNLQLFKDIRQRSMPAAIGIDCCGNLNFTGLNVVNFKSFRMPEMPEYLSVFIGYRDSHISFPRFLVFSSCFQANKICFLRPLRTVPP
jgi:hypothetical protein